MKFIIYTATQCCC